MIEITSVADSYCAAAAVPSVFLVSSIHGVLAAVHPPGLQPVQNLRFKAYSTNGTPQRAPMKARAHRGLWGSVQACKHARHTWGCPVMRYHFVVYHAALQEASPPPQLRPCRVFPPKAPHGAEEPHIPGDGRSAPPYK